MRKGKIIELVCFNHLKPIFRRKRSSKNMKASLKTIFAKSIPTIRRGLDLHGAINAKSGGELSSVHLGTT